MIYTLIDPESMVLKVPLSDVSFDNFEEQFHLTPLELKENLIESMMHHKGIGLSANQCGVMIRAFVMYTDFDNAKHQIFFNPRITWESEQTEFYEEGCLTYPYLFLNIKRPYIVEFTYQNENGEEKTGKYAGLTSRVFQHEYDHMEGKNFTQMVSPLKLKMAKKKAAKIMKRKTWTKKN